MATIAKVRHCQGTDTAAAVRYGVAVGAVAVAYALQRAIWPLVPPSPHLFFYPAVFLAARVGGSRPGYVATALSTFAIAHGFLPPTGLFAIQDPSDALDLAIFFAVCIGISAAVGQLHEALKREQRAAVVAREAKQSTDETWSMVAHDLRQPLSVINMGSTELGRRATTPPDMEKMLQLIQRSTHRARDLIDHALDAMRAAEGKLVVAPAPCDVAELCAHALDAVALLGERKGVKLDSDVSARHAVACDQPRLEQVLTNLLGNAIEFTPRNGVVSLYADETDDGIVFSVRDTGRGIPADEIGAIFTKFWSSAHSPGTGLGLWIAGAILEAHGSKLDVASRVGEGTTFSFTLPIVHEGSAPRAALA
ncbi:MAG: Sensory box histidine kinase [Labilithrix sp.]|nr:Sensory box histidine kinase [Labilithrix sp.]